MNMQFMKRAVELAEQGMSQNAGGPFGCVIVKNGNIIAEGHNCVTSDNDPTAHAEVVAIRAACKKLGTFQLNGCELYTSCEPCPMCLGAIYWARPDNVYYAANRQDAAAAGFDDDFIYEELNRNPEERKILMHNFGREHALAVFNKWAAKEDKTRY